LAVLGNSPVYGTQEVSITPGADTGLAIGGDVRRGEHAKGRLECDSTSKPGASPPGVAHPPVPRPRQGPAPGDPITAAQLLRDADRARTPVGREAHRTGSCETQRRGRQ